MLRMTSRCLAWMAGATDSNAGWRSVWVGGNEEFCRGPGLMRNSDGDVFRDSRGQRRD